MQTILLRDYVCVLNKGVAGSTYESWIYKRKTHGMSESARLSSRVVNCAGVESTPDDRRCTASTAGNTTIICSITCV